MQCCRVIKGRPIQRRGWQRDRLAGSLGEHRLKQEGQRRIYLLLPTLLVRLGSSRTEMCLKQGQFWGREVSLKTQEEHQQSPQASQIVTHT